MRRRRTRTWARPHRGCWAAPSRAGHFGLRATELSGLPKTAVDVDGSKAYLNLEISVRWPAPVPPVVDQLRSHLRSRIAELTGLSVEEVHIVVADLVTDITPPPRVR